MHIVSISVAAATIAKCTQDSNSRGELLSISADHRPNVYVGRRPLAVPTDALATSWLCAVFSTSSHLTSAYVSPTKHALYDVPACLGHVHCRSTGSIQLQQRSVLCHVANTEPVKSSELSASCKSAAALNSIVNTIMHDERNLGKQTKRRKGLTAKSRGIRQAQSCSCSWQKQLQSTLQEGEFGSPSCQRFA